MQILEALRVAAPQLKNVGSFNRDKLNSDEKQFLLGIERVFIDAYAGDFKSFFGDVAAVYADAKKKGDDPEVALKTWIKSEIQVLRQEVHIKTAH